MRPHGAAARTPERPSLAEPAAPSPRPRRRDGGRRVVPEGLHGSPRGHQLAEPEPGWAAPADPQRGRHGQALEYCGRPVLRAPARAAQAVGVDLKFELLPCGHPAKLSKASFQLLQRKGHESYVTFCQLEEEAAFTCSADCTIRRWDVLTGQCLQVYRGHTSIVNRILVANNQLFSGSYDRTARVWTVDDGQASRELRGHRNCVLTLAHSSPWEVPGTPHLEEAMAGGLLVTGSTDGTAKVWQVASGCCHQTLRGHTGAVLCLVLDAPGRTAFTGSTDATIRAWDILSGGQLRVFREHQGSVICLELVDRLLYSGSADRTAKCWLAHEGEHVCTFPAHRHSVSTLKYHAGTQIPTQNGGLLTFTSMWGDCMFRGPGVKACLKDTF
ncbi:WD repeat-containing protein 86 isoform X3 [Marmota marmota marmota]|uniref:WD repeat-containing protein 86 isoform X3 n=1 Tax=Marmota marmota marmota TaxID=9994 RepID=UPI002093CE69|nr:WD repeat-containing protein 86 isoform X3 [Marmota marmota marmota]